VIAAALGVSARFVSDIFGANEQSVSHYIWWRRLQKCHAALADPFQRGRSISSIAFGWASTTRRTSAGCSKAAMACRRGTIAHVPAVSRAKGSSKSAAASEALPTASAAADLGPVVN
jgi:hypothetical protein